MQKNLWIRKKDVPLQSFQTKVVLTREHSSVGLEHLPYKQRVGGSTPSAPTRSLTVNAVRLFSYICLKKLQHLNAFMSAF